MSHVRKQIRDAVGALLSASTEIDAVFKTQIKPARDIWRIALVYTKSEQSEALVIHPTQLIERVVGLTVKVFQKFTDDEDVEDYLDVIASDVETRLTYSALNSALSGNLKSIVLTSSDSDIEEDENQRTAAVLTLEWEVRIHTVEGSPETMI